jgi:hypothetical protein
MSAATRSVLPIRPMARLLVDRDTGHDDLRQRVLQRRALLHLLVARSRAAKSANVRYGTQPGQFGRLPDPPRQLRVVELVVRVDIELAHFLVL